MTFQICFSFRCILNQAGSLYTCRFPHRSHSLFYYCLFLHFLLQFQYSLYSLDPFVRAIFLSFFDQTSFNHQVSYLDPRQLITCQWGCVLCANEAFVSPYKFNTIINSTVVIINFKMKSSSGDFTRRKTHVPNKML